jgi:hypothetical protein
VSPSHSGSPALVGGITLLTVATAAIHFYVGASFGSTLFVLNGVGYLALLAAFLLPLPQLARFREAVRWTLVGYAGLTIVLYFVLVPAFRPIGLVDKAIEAALVALLLIDARRPPASPRGRA